MTSDPIGDIGDAQGRELLDSNGQPLGQILEIFLDETTGRPAWAAVDAPGGGNDLVLAPLAHSTREGDAVRVAVTRERVESSPSTMGLTERFSPEHMDRVRAHYAEQPAGGQADTAYRSDVGRQAGTAVSGELPGSMVRSEEELFVQRERVPRERVRLVKRIVVETVTQTVEVRREEVHVERIAVTGSGEGASYAEPSAAGGTVGDDVAIGTGSTASGEVGYAEGTAAGDTGSGARATGQTSASGTGTGLGGLRARASSLVGKAGERFGGGHGFGEAFTDQTLDLTLYEEQVVVSKRVVPRERVRVHREVVTEQQRISDELRKERVEVERVGLDADTRLEGGYRPETGF